MAETEPDAPQEPQTEEEPKQELAERPERTYEITQDGGFDIWRNPGTFNHLHRVAKMFADSELVPVRYRGKPNDTMIVMAMAMRHNADPMMFLQGMYVVQGNPGMEAKLAIALANKAGVFKGAITYDYSGQDMGRKCVASAIDAKSGKLLTAECSIKIAKAEGWLAKKGSKWVSIPDLMLSYRSAMFLIRKHYPDVIYGMLSRDEAEEIAAREIQIVTIDEQRQEIIDAVDHSADGDGPKELTEPETEEPEQPLEQTMADAAEVVEGDPPEEPKPDQDGQLPLEPVEEKPEEKEPTERETLLATYRDMAQMAGESLKKGFARFTVPTLKKEIDRLTEKLESK